MSLDFPWSIWGQYSDVTLRCGCMGREEEMANGSVTSIHAMHR